MKFKLGSSLSLLSYLIICVIGDRDIGLTDGTPGSVAIAADTSTLGNTRSSLHFERTFNLFLTKFI